MRPPLIATPPLLMTRRELSIVTTVPPLIIRSTVVFLRWASEGIIEAQSTQAATTILANANLFIEASLVAALQESSVERLRQKVSDIDNFALAFQVRQRNLSVLGVLPNNLPARAARRRQLFRVNHDHQICKVAFAFRQSLPNRDAFSADG